MSQQCKCNDDPTLINDDIFTPAGVLAPKSKADFAFVLHALNYLSSKGRDAIVCFPGIFYRDGAEKKIRQYLVDNNFVETVISLASNLFYGTYIAVKILTDEHIAKIMEMFDTKKDVKYTAVTVDNIAIAENDYNLSVSSYVDTKDTREVIDIVELNKIIASTVEKIDYLRSSFNSIVAELEGDNL